MLYIFLISTNIASWFTFRDAPLLFRQEVLVGSASKRNRSWSNANVVRSANKFKIPFQVHNWTVKLWLKLTRSLWNLAPIQELRSQLNLCTKFCLSRNLLGKESHTFHRSRRNVIQQGTLCHWWSRRSKLKRDYFLAFCFFIIQYRGSNQEIKIR